MRPIKFMNDQFATNTLTFICDGYKVVINKTFGNFLRILDNNDNVLFESPDAQLNVGSTPYFYCGDSGIDCTVPITRDSYTKAFLVGNWNDTIGSTGSYLTNSNFYIYIVHIYIDRIFVEIRQINSGTVTLDNDSDNCLFNLVPDSQYTNGRFWYESSDSELEASVSTNYDSTKSLVNTSDNVNIQVVRTHSDINGTASDIQRFGSDTDGDIRIGWNNGTILSGDSRFGFAIIIDSIDREDTTPSIAWLTATVYSTEDLRVNNGIGYECISGHTSSATDEPGTGASWETYWVQCHKYTSADRIEICNQLLSGVPYDINVGSSITDSQTPLYIGNGLTIDGQYNIGTNASNQADIDFNKSIHSPIIQLHDSASLRVGDISNPTELLVGHWLCDDNAASTVIIDETGNNNGTLEGGDNTSTISSTDSNSVRSLQLNDTDDYIDLSAVISSLDDPGRFTLSFWWKPNYDLNVSGNNNILELYYDADNNIRITRVDGFIQLLISANSEDIGVVIMPQNTVNEILQNEWHYIKVSVDMNLKIVMFTFATEITKCSNILGGLFSNDFTSFRFGYSASAGDGDCHISDIRLYNSCIMDELSSIPGNIPSYSKVSDEVTLYMKGDESDKDPFRIGEGRVNLQSVAQTETNVFNEANSSFSLTSTSSVVNIPTANIDYSKFTLTFWFKFSSWAVGDYLFSDSASPSNLCCFLQSDNEGWFYNIRVTVNGVSEDYGILPVSQYVWVNDDTWRRFSLSVDLALNFIFIGILSINDEALSTKYDFSASSPVSQGDFLQMGKSAGSESVIVDFCEIQILNSSSKPTLPVSLNRGNIHTPVIKG